MILLFKSGFEDPLLLLQNALLCSNFFKIGLQVCAVQTILTTGHNNDREVTWDRAENFKGKEGALRGVRKGCRERGTEDSEGRSKEPEIPTDTKDAGA